MGKNITVSVTEFKAHCLEYIQTLKTSGADYIVTKRNIPIAKLVPYETKTNEFRFGGLKDTMTIKGDILSSIPVNWEENL